MLPRDRRGRRVTSDEGNGSANPLVELLYFEGCPNYIDYLPRLRQILESAGMPPEVSLKRIDSEDMAASERFLGSPTVRVDGQDVEPAAAARTEYGLQCRLYRTGSGWAGNPPDEWVRSALHTAAEVA